jgi:glycosyltransferase involved in cell wall biosynthesis
VKVVVAHNRYRSAYPSGENRIVDSEIHLLRGVGVEVVPFVEDSDELEDSRRAVASAAFGPVASPRGVRRLNRLIREYEPDVLHLHNVYPLVSPWAVRVARAAGVPVVQTVHNYRHTCVAGTHLRDGLICEDCRFTRTPWPAVQHACYRGSRGQSLAMAVGQVVHRPTWRLVDRFLVASPHMEERLVDTGIARDRIEWRPTFAEDAGYEAVPRRGPLLFVGRLEYAKGIELLLRAWTDETAVRWGKLVIAGSGPLAHLVQERAAHDASVEWRGSLDAMGIRTLMQQCSLVLLPSLWFEGFPRVAAEAMSVGRPLLVWRGAGFSRIADYGAGWALPNEPAAWTEKLLSVEHGDLVAASRGARRVYDQRCSPEAAVSQLLRTYESVVPSADSN